MFCIESGALHAFRNLVVGDIFVVGQELPCLDKGKRWISERLLCVFIASGECVGLAAQTNQASYRDLH